MGHRLVEKRVRRFYRRGEFARLSLPLSQARGATPGGPRFRRTPAMRLRTGSAPSHPASPNSENAPPSTSPAAKFFFEKTACIRNRVMPYWPHVFSGHTLRRSGQCGHCAARRLESKPAFLFVFILRDFGTQKTGVGRLIHQDTQLTFQGKDLKWKTARF